MHVFFQTQPAVLTAPGESLCGEACVCIGYVRYGRSASPSGHQGTPPVRHYVCASQTRLPPENHCEEKRCLCIGYVMLGMVRVLPHQGTKAPLRFDTMLVLLNRAYRR